MMPRPFLQHARIADTDMPGRRREKKWLSAARLICVFLATTWLLGCDGDDAPATEGSGILTGVWRGKPSWSENTIFFTMDMWYISHEGTAVSIEVVPESGDEYAMTGSYNAATRVLSILSSTRLFAGREFLLSSDNNTLAPIGGTAGALNRQ